MKKMTEVCTVLHTVIFVGMLQMCHRLVPQSEKREDESVESHRVFLRPLRIKKRRETADVRVITNPATVKVRAFRSLERINQANTQAPSIHTQATSIHTQATFIILFIELYGPS
jgi:hypothetical protein